MSNRFGGSCYPNWFGRFGGPSGSCWGGGPGGSVHLVGLVGLMGLVGLVGLVGPLGLVGLSGESALWVQREFQLEVWTSIIQMSWKIPNKPFVLLPK